MTNDKVNERDKSFKLTNELSDAIRSTISNEFAKASENASRQILRMLEITANDGKPPLLKGHGQGKKQAIEKHYEVLAIIEDLCKCKVKSKVGEVEGFTINMAHERLRANGWSRSRKTTERRIDALVVKGILETFWANGEKAYKVALRPEK